MGLCFQQSSATLNVSKDCTYLFIKRYCFLLIDMKSFGKSQIKGVLNDGICLWQNWKHWRECLTQNIMGNFPHLPPQGVKSLKTYSKNWEVEQGQTHLQQSPQTWFYLDVAQSLIPNIFDLSSKLSKG